MSTTLADAVGLDRRRLQRGIMQTVLRTAEAIEIHGRGRVRHRVSSGQWQAPYRGVIVTHSGPISALERDTAMLKVGAPGSVLAGASSLHHDGFQGFDQPSTYVVIPEGADRPRHRGLVTHWSTQLDDLDVHPLKVPRRTRPARSLVDMASWADNDRYARTVVIAGIQQGLASAPLLHQAVQRRGSCRRRALITESILDATGGIQSLPERDFDDIRHQARLPRPSRQARVRGPDGNYYLDAYWDDLRLAVEVHGAPHREIGKWDAGILRGNEIVIDKRHLLLFTSYAIRHERAVVADQLTRMFLALGWRAQ